MSAPQKNQSRPGGGGLVGHLNSFNQNHNATSNALQHQLDTDAALEGRIDALNLRFLATTDTGARRQIWIEIKAAIGARSAGQVHRMELAKGLRS